LWNKSILTKKIDVLDQISTTHLELATALIFKIINESVEEDIPFKFFEPYLKKHSKYIEKYQAINQSDYLIPNCDNLLFEHGSYIYCFFIQGVYHINEKKYNIAKVGHATIRSQRLDNIKSSWKNSKKNTTLKLPTHAMVRDFFMKGKKLDIDKTANLLFLCIGGSFEEDFIRYQLASKYGFILEESFIKSKFPDTFDSWGGIAPTEYILIDHNKLGEIRHSFDEGKIKIENKTFKSGAIAELEGIN